MSFILDSSGARKICLLIILIIVGATAFCRSVRAQAAAPGPWQIEWQGPRGLTLSYDSVPLIRQSSLYIVKPGWTGLLFDGRNQKYKTTRDAGNQPALTVVGENENFRAEYRFEALDTRRFRLHFKGELKRDVPASIEYAAGYFNANLLANRAFRAQTKDGPKSGIVPAYPATSEQMANEVAPNFESLQFDSRLGKLDIKVLSTARVMFFDARREPQDWARPLPIFWCGWLAGMQPLQFGRPVELELTLSLDALPAVPHEQLTMQAALSKIPNAQSARERPIQIIPRPRRLQIANAAPFHLDKNTRVSIVVPRGETRLPRALQKMWREQWHLGSSPPQIQQHAQKWARITMGKPVIRSSRDRDKVLWWRHTEGYFLRAGTTGIEITAPSPQGAFYGLQSLAQLLELEKSGARCRSVTVEDWPALSFRGAHWFPSASGVPFHKKMIERILARHKFNACVIQCEAARWDTNPKLAAPNSISKNDLRALVQVCRDNFIEPIPLINVPGHAEWMFRNGQNLDLAEDPQTPYAYAVNNPKSQQFVQHILEEAIEVFHPKYFHIGHDEVTMRGRFPNAENPFYQADKTAGDLVLDNLHRLHAWLKTRGVQTMIWGDMLLSPQEGVDAAQAPSLEEVRRRRTRVPPDVLVTDWHYGSNEKYPSLNIFKNAGLDTVAATWHAPINIYHFAHAAKANGARGLLQTTWAGYFPDQSTLKTAASQFAAFIFAGDYAWSNRDEMPAALPYDAISEWQRAFDGNDDSAPERHGALLDLTPVARVNPDDWLNLGQNWDLSEFFSASTSNSSRPNSSQPDTRRYDDVLFRIAKRRFVVLASASTRRLAPAGSLSQFTIKTEKQCSELAFLHSGLWPVAQGTAIARMTVQYSDGTQSTLDFKQGDNTSAWQADANAPSARRGWMQPSLHIARDVSFALRVTRWKNPFPRKTISHLQFQATSTETGWALAGLTLLD